MRLPREERRRHSEWARIVDAYDGDTVTIVHLVSGRLMKRRCRIAGIDAPELKGDSRDRGIVARDALRTLLPRWPTRVHIQGIDKYGRPLVVFRLSNGVNVDEYMILNGYAVAYDGGTKQAS